MLGKAKDAAKEQVIYTEFMLSDIEALDFPENTFDTIVSTLSFCGYEHPVQMFSKIQRWCKSQGRVSLMEHGISSNPVLAFVQKVIDPVHLIWATLGE